MCASSTSQTTCGPAEYSAAGGSLAEGMSGSKPHASPLPAPRSHTLQSCALFWGPIRQMIDAEVIVLPLAIERVHVPQGAVEMGVARRVILVIGVALAKRLVVLLEFLGDQTRQSGGNRDKPVPRRCPGAMGRSGGCVSHKNTPS